MDAKQEHLTKNDAGRQSVGQLVVGSAEHQADFSSTQFIYFTARHRYVLACMKDFSTDQLMILQNPEYICAVNLSREWSEYTVVSLWLQTDERHIW